LLISLGSDHGLIKNNKFEKHMKGRQKEGLNLEE